MAIQRFCILLFFALMIAACSTELRVTPGGPAVHDQLIGRGYIGAPNDTVSPVDTVRWEVDSL